MGNFKKERKVDYAWSYIEEEKKILLELYSDNNLKEWINKFVYFAHMSYSLGPFWINLGNYYKRLLREGKEVKQVDVINSEKTILIFVTWLTKVVFGPSIKMNFINVAKSRDKFLVGRIDEFINIDRILEEINSLSIRELREMTEIFATAHIVISDALYQIDFGSTIANTEWAEQIEKGESNRDVIKNKVSTWQAYGRYSLRKFREYVIKDFKKEKSECLLIPCTLTKPYYGNLKVISESTEKGNLIKKEIAKEDKDVIVMTTIGIVPQKYWLDPIDLGYEVRVPMLYDDLISMKNFFIKNQYEVVHSWLNYPPYIEMLIMLLEMGVIKKIEWMVDPNMTTKKGNYGAFFAVKSSDLKYEERIKKLEERR